MLTVLVKWVLQNVLSSVVPNSVTPRERRAATLFAKALAHFGDLSRAILPLCVCLLGGLLSCASDIAGSGGSSGTPNGMVAAQVVYPDGTPAAGVIVRIRGAQFLAHLGDSDTLRTRDLVTGTDGAFSAATLDTGAYLIEITDSLVHASAVSVHITDRQPQQNLGTLRLDSASLVTGALLGPGGQGVEGHIGIRGLERDAQAGTDGAFVIPLMPRGRFELVARPVSQRYVEEVSDSVVVEGSAPVQLAPLTVPPSGGQKTIRINTTGTGVPTSEDLFGFPVLVRLARSELDFSSLSQDGRTMRFIRNGKELYYQIDCWDTANSRAAIWVRIDTLRANKETVLSLAWGGDSASSYHSPQMVFDTAAGFDGVWHLSENQPGTGGQGVFRDATHRQRHGDDFVNDEGSDGIVGDGQRFAGTDHIAVAPAYAPGGPFTIEAWFRVDTLLGTVSKIAGTFEDSTNYTYGWQLKLRRDDLNFNAGDGSLRQTVAAWQVVTPGVWHHYAAVYVPGAGSATLFLDGMPVALNDTVTAANIVYKPELKTYISDPELPFHGTLDEVRFSGRAHSETWLKLSYENQRADQKLVTVE